MDEDTIVLLGAIFVALLLQFGLPRFWPWVARKIDGPGMSSLKAWSIILPSGVLPIIANVLAGVVLVAFAEQQGYLPELKNNMLGYVGMALGFLLTVISVMVIAARSEQRRHQQAPNPPEPRHSE